MYRSQPIDVPVRTFHTDGSSLPSRSVMGFINCGGWAVIENCKVLRSGNELNATNNYMEMMAILEAISTMEANSHATIFTDSIISIRWMVRRYAIRSNLAILEVRDMIDNLMLRNNLKITFKHVKGHRGDTGNEMADEEASNQARDLKNYLEEGWPVGGL